MKIYVYILSSFFFLANAVKAQMKVMDITLKPLITIEKTNLSEHSASNLKPKMEHTGFMVQLQLSIGNIPCKGKLVVRIGVEKNTTEFLNETFDVKCDAEYGRELINLYKQGDTLSKRAIILNNFLSLTSVVSSKEKAMAKWLSLYSIDESGRESEKTFYQIK